MIRTSSAESHRINQMGMAESATATLLNYMQSVPHATRKQIAKETGIETATVSGLVKPMLKMGVLIESKEKRPCPVTGRNVFFVRVAK